MVTPGPETDAPAEPAAPAQVLPPPPSPRRGGLVLASCLIVAAMWAGRALVGHHFDPAASMSDVARLQVFYVAEMGLNDVMFDANAGNARPLFPAGAAVGTTVSFDYSDRVWLTRHDGGSGHAGSSRCTVVLTGVAPDRRVYRSTATLDLDDGRRVNSIVSFTAVRQGNPPTWVLADYRVEK